MEGYFINENKKPNGTLKIDITNVSELDILLKRANEETLQLLKTIGELQSFGINIDFSIKDTTSES